jgi:fermentation-respiration switch protein FrsA (DUF1100 family)
LLVCVCVSGCGQAADDQAAAGTETAAVAADPTDPCNPVNLAAEAVASGTRILAGVTLEGSTPIADILAGPDQFAGKHVRIEGTIVEICSNQGCWALIEDPAGNRLNLKVTDGEVDFRDLVQTGQYAVGEGVFTTEGEHGAQVDIMSAGAMVSSTACPVGT